MLALTLILSPKERFHKERPANCAREPTPSPSKEGNAAR